MSGGFQSAVVAQPGTLFLRPKFVIVPTQSGLNVRVVASTTERPEPSPLPAARA